MYASNGVKVTFQTISQAQGDVSNTVARINQQHSDLRNHLAPLVSSWEGSASSDYQTLQRRWDSASADLNAVLQEISRMLGTAHDTYRQTEQSNTAVWAG